MTIQQLMIAVSVIAVVVLAPLMWVSAFLRSLNVGLQDAYGKEGKFDLERQIRDECELAETAFRQRDFAEAEARYRSVSKLCDRLQAKAARNVWSALASDSPPARDADLGIADAVAGQGRHAEADELYRQGLAAREQRLGRDDGGMVEVLDRYALFLRTTGRVPEAKERERRAVRILEQVIKTERKDEQSKYWDEVEKHARAIRERPDL
jgi:tetratricopeptide (TPR) repeat protein